jgi:hypothetical protein
MNWLMRGGKRMGRYMNLAVVACMGAVLLTALNVGAEEKTQGWKFEVTPYAWLAGLEGDVTINGEKTDFEKSFSDLFDYVELGASIRLGAEYNRFCIGALVDHISLNNDKLEVNGQPGVGSLDTKLLLTEMAAGYRIDGWSEGQSYVLMLGVRNLKIENDLDVYGVGSFSRDNNVTDCMLYVLPSIPMFPSKIQGLRFNPVLGIGAGDSDYVYELFPQVQYNFTDKVAGRLGYRKTGWKYTNDNNNEMNLQIAGLIVGLGATF